MTLTLAMITVNTTDALSRANGWAVDRLLAAGAAKVADRNIGDFRWTVLTDPDGNEFCVAGGPEPGPQS